MLILGLFSGLWQTDKKEFDRADSDSAKSKAIKVLGQAFAMKMGKTATPSEVRLARVSTQDDPEPNWSKLRGKLVNNRDKGSSRPKKGSSRPKRDRDATAGNYLSSSFSSVHDYTFSGIIRNNRLRKRRRPPNLDEMELAAYYAEPSYAILRRPKNNAHWVW